MGKSHVEALLPGYCDWLANEKRGLGEGRRYRVRHEDPKFTVTHEEDAWFSPASLLASSLERKYVSHRTAVQEPSIAENAETAE
jgi:hypothetical protein